MKIEKAVFGMGCFWHPQLIFSEVSGVINTSVGFAGGEIENPSYEDVCGGETGHAEVVMIEFDSEKISYEDLLKIFWENHDPRQEDRQGPDVGRQYRSVVFYFNDGQRKNAFDSLKDEQKKYDEKIVTSIEKFDKFYRAEEYHQDYLNKTGKRVC